MQPGIFPFLWDVPLLPALVSLQCPGGRVFAKANDAFLPFLLAEVLAIGFCLWGTPADRAPMHLLRTPSLPLATAACLQRGKKHFPGDLCSPRIGAPNTRAACSWREGVIVQPSVSPLWLCPED